MGLKKTESMYTRPALQDRTFTDHCSDIFAREPCDTCQMDENTVIAIPGQGLNAKGNASASMNDFLSHFRQAGIVGKLAEHRNGQHLTSRSSHSKAKRLGPPTLPQVVGTFHLALQQT